jgi:hypothetical protein
MPATPDLKQYPGGAVDATLTANIGVSDTSIGISVATNWPDGSLGKWTVVINPGGVNEEKVYVASRSGLSLSLIGGTRSYDGTAAASHNAGETVRCVWESVSGKEANDHERASTQVHGLAFGVAAVGDTSTQTLANKTLTAPVLTAPVVADFTSAQHDHGDADDGGPINAASGSIILPQAAVPAQTAEGSIVWDTDNDLLTVGDGAGRKTLIDEAAPQTLQNKTLNAPTISSFENAVHTHELNVPGYGGATHSPKRARKTANEVVNNSAALQNDDELSFAIGTLGASEVWAFEFMVTYTSASADFRCDITGTAGIQLHWTVVPYFSTADVWQPPADAEAVSPFIIGSAAAKRTVFLKGVARSAAGASGIIQLRWAQGTATAEDTTVYLDSYCIAHRLA